MAAPSSRKRKCSWIRVVPSSAASVGPFTVSTVAIGLLPVVAQPPGPYPVPGGPPCTKARTGRRKIAGGTNAVEATGVRPTAGQSTGLRRTARHQSATGSSRSFATRRAPGQPWTPSARRSARPSEPATPPASSAAARSTRRAKRASGRLTARAALVEHGTEHDPDHHHDDRDQQLQQARPRDPVAQERTERQQEREHKRRELPHAWRGIAEDEARQEEEDVRHAPPFPTTVASQSCGAIGTGHPGLEPGTACFGDRSTSHCATAPAGTDSRRGLESLNTRMWRNWNTRRL